MVNLRLRHILFSLGAGSWVLLSAGHVRAWNPLESAGRSLGKGLLESALVPSLQTAEASGHRLVGDVDERLADRIDHVGRTVDASLVTADGLIADRLGQVDEIAAARLGQADTILAARILQIDTSANALVDKSLGEVDRISRERVAQVGREGRRLVRVLDGRAQQRLEQADAILQARIGQVNEAVQQSIVHADGAVEARITQLDELTGRRLGNVDVIATKQSLNIEGSLLKVAALVALLVFLVFVLREIYRDIDAYYDQADTSVSRVRSAVGATGRVLKGVAKRLAVAAVGALILIGAIRQLPLGAQRRADELVATHERAMAASVAVLDLTRVRYHASQLALLVPERDAAYRAQAAETELVRDVLSRPGMLLHPEGVRALMVRMATVQRAFGEDAERPDLLTLQGYVTWQVATTRTGERVAAERCARALERARQHPELPFLLRPLAHSYLRAYAHNPAPGGEPLVTVDDAGGELAFAPLRHVLDYDAALRRLDVTSSNAYVDMLRAHARFARETSALPGGASVPELGQPADGLSPAQAAVLAANTERLGHARAVVGAWRAFDAELTGNPHMMHTSASFAALTLNDAVLSHALWLEANPNALDLPPAIAAEPDSWRRVQMAPVRIAWTRRVVGLLGKDSQRLLLHEQTRRFADLEKHTLAFARSFVASEEGRDDPGAAERHLAAAQAAAELGLYTGAVGARRPLGTELLPSDAPAAARDAVVSAYDARHLRFL